MKPNRTPLSPHDDTARREVRHAVFPVAGFGANSCRDQGVPQGMLPIVDRPLIQYAVEEAAAAGLTRMIFVTGRGKRAIEDHFDRAYELEHELAACANDDALRELRSAVPAGVTFSYVRQREASGLLDALRKARPLLGDEPFAVMLPDQLIDAERPALAQLLDVFAEQRVSVVGTERVSPSARIAASFIGADLGTSAIRPARALVKVPPIGALRRRLQPRGGSSSHPRSGMRSSRSATPAPAIVRSARDPCTDGARTCVRLHDRRAPVRLRIEAWLPEAQFAYAQKRADLWNDLRESLDELLTHTPEQRQRTVAALTSESTGAGATGGS